MRIQVDGLTAQQAAVILGDGYAESVNQYGPNDNWQYRIASRELTDEEADAFLGLAQNPGVVTP